MGTVFSGNGLRRLSDWCWCNPLLSYPRPRMSSFDCPYKVGAEFSLVLTPPVYSNHGPFASIPTSYEIRVKVVEIYSFTKSQAMKVSTSPISAQGDPIPSTAFLKIYDRRYLRERMSEQAKYPWNHNSSNDPYDNDNDIPSTFSPHAHRPAGRSKKNRIRNFPK